MAELRLAVPASKRVRRVRGALAAAALAWLAACAATPAESELRILVRLAQPSTDSVAITRLVSDRAGAAARYGGSVSLVWHSLVLSCAATDCETLLQRLRAEHTAFGAVERDERKRIVSP